MTMPETLPPNQTQSPTEAETPIFPPWVLLAVAGVALFAMVFFLMTRREAGVEVFGALGVAVLSLFAWGLMNPDQLRDTLRGRAVSYGGTAVLVTVIFMIALVFVYIIVRQQGWKRDLSDQKILTLTEQARDIIGTIAADPTMPALKIIGFYGVSDASYRDLAEILLDDVVSASNGKITYEFIDPDQNPLVVEGYKAQARQFIVGPVTADNKLDPNNIQTLAGIDQQSIIDALITASSTGTFNAYFLRVQDGVDFETPEAGGGQLLSESLASRYKWNTKTVSMLDLTDETPTFTLNDPNVDGEVMVIGGGTAALTADQVKVITDYLDKGGNLVIFAGLNLEGNVPLAAAEPLSTYLYDNFGIKVNNDLVIDTDYRLGNNDFSFQAFPANVDHFIVNDFKENGILLFGGVHSIDVNPQPPAGVTTTVLASSSETAYSKDMSDMTATIEKAEGDKSGALPLVVASDNAQKGSRVVVFGSIDSALNEASQYEAASIHNTDLARNAIVWAAGYDSFRNIPSLEIVIPQPVPLFATDAQVSLVQFVAVLLLPALILLVGGWRWWARRERERA
jgi:hypothetical protein